MIWLGCVETTDLLNNLALYIKELNQKIVSLIKSYELQAIIATPRINFIEIFYYLFHGLSKITLTC